MGNIIYKNCTNCGNTIKKTVNYCRHCGYPTPKRLKEVDNPEAEIDRALRREYTLYMRIRYHGLINVLNEEGMMSDDKAEKIRTDLLQTMAELLRLKDELNK